MNSAYELSHCNNQRKCWHVQNKIFNKNITCKYHVTCGRINNTSENQKSKKKIFLNIGEKYHRQVNWISQDEMLSQTTM